MQLNDTISLLISTLYLAAVVLYHHWIVIYSLVPYWRLVRDAFIFVFQYVEECFIYEEIKQMQKNMELNHKKHIAKIW